MKALQLIVAGAVVSVFVANPAWAQVRTLNSLPSGGRVVPASCACEGGDLWNDYGSQFGAVGPTYGAPCGGCGSCNSCGVGGYLGRNIHPVDPCACGGSLIADLAFGIKCLLDRTVTCVFQTVFGGLHTIGCHASGTLAAMHCAAANAICSSCGQNCGGGCGASAYYGSCDSCETTMMDADEYWPTEADAYPSMSPTEAMPTPAQQDPFIDDPVPGPPSPEARRLRRFQPLGRQAPPRGGNVRPVGYQQPAGGVVGTAVQRVLKPSARNATTAVQNSRSRYFGNREATIRR